MKAFKVVILVLLAANCLATHADSESFPHENGVATAPDGWLLSGKGPKWWYRSQPSINPVQLRQRKATPSEQKVIDRATEMMERLPIKAIALIDGDRVVYQDFNAPAGPLSVILSMSIGKTVTSMTVGQVICDGKLSLTTRAEELIPELKGKQLGETTVRDLLRMASGTRNDAPFSDAFTTEQTRAWRVGGVNLVDVIVEDRNALAKKGLFSDYKPGEQFAYKGSDPIALAIMAGRAEGVSFAQLVQTKVLDLLTPIES